MELLLLGNVALIAVCAAWLVPFICILRYGTHIVQEPCLGILLCEIGTFVVLMALAVVNIVILGKKYIGGASG